MMKIDLQDLLKIEEDDKLFSFKITDLEIPLWLLLRIDIYFFIQFNLLNLSNPHVQVNLLKSPLKSKIKYIFSSIMKHPIINKKYDILIFGADINNVLENNLYYNRLYDPLYEQLENKLLLLESSNKFSYSTPRFNREVRYTDIIRILPYIANRFIKEDKKDIEIIDTFINYVTSRVKNILNIDLSTYFNKKYQKIKKIPNYLKIRVYLYNKILNMIKPKLLIIEDAHYGGHAELIKLSKSKNIKVAEFQHGYIGKNHLAYNYLESTKRHLSDFLPDYMLYWGEYWANNSDIPGKKYVIGFPYLEKKVKELFNVEKEIFILVISGGSIPQDYITIINKLLEFFKEKNIVFRPHPSERPAVSERYREIINKGIMIDTGNLYESLSKSHICISLEVSTVLFEATVFCEKVFLIKSRASIPYIDENFPIEIIENAEDLNYMLDKEILSTCNRANIFSPEWKTSFINFLSEVCIRYDSNS